MGIKMILIKLIIIPSCIQSDKSSKKSTRPKLGHNIQEVMKYVKLFGNIKQHGKHMHDAATLFHKFCIQLNLSKKHHDELSALFYLVLYNMSNGGYTIENILMYINEFLENNIDNFKEGVESFKSKYNIHEVDRKPGFLSTPNMLIEKITNDQNLLNKNEPYRQDIKYLKELYNVKFGPILKLKNTVVSNLNNSDSDTELDNPYGYSDKE